MKKLLTLLLAAALLLSLAACGGDSQPADTDEAVSYDWDAAYAAYAPDTAVLTVNGEDVCWDEYFYWLFEEYIKYGQGHDLNEDFPDAGMTIGEFIAAGARDYCVQYRVLEQKAEELGVELTETDLEVLDEQLKSDIAEYVGEDGTEAELYEYLSGLYVTEELYNYVNRMMVLYPRMFMQLYGELGESVSDEDALAFAETYGFMTVKHILFQTGGGNDEAQLERANADLNELRAVPEEDRAALFDELMARDSEDPGLASYPDGYCFEPGVVHEEFAEAAAALAPGEISDIVETQDGYHILMRVETTPDDLVLMGTAVPYTLRYACAVMSFNEDFSSWVNEAEAAYTPEFAGFNPTGLFD